MACLHGCLLGLIYQYLAAVIQFPLVPVRPVVQMYFPCGRVFGKGGGSSLVVCAPLIPSGLGDLSFRMCHDLLFFVR